MKRLVIGTGDSAETEAVGERIGKRLRGGEVIELVSDLGGGKTTFVRGVARGAGSKDQVSSPTFKISNVYKTSKLEIHHFDFYRLNEAGIIAQELSEVISDPEIVVVSEWANVVHHVLPDQRLAIKFESIGDDLRRITLTYPAELSYLTKNLS